MKTRNLIAFTMAGFFGLALITSCGGGKTGDQAKTDSTAVKEQAAPAQPTEPTAAQMEMGEKIYETPGKCITCHQANGQGIANVFPNLVGSKFLLEQKVLAVSQVLNGSLKVGNKTVKYPAPMTPQLDNKEEAVAVINYVLNSFGNHGGVVTMEDVKDVVIDPR
jgi:nitrite reductase (NO-forming)